MILRKLKWKSIKKSWWLFILSIVLLVFGVLFFSLKPSEAIRIESLSYNEVENQGSITITKFIPLVEFATQETNYSSFYYFIIVVADKNNDIYLMALRTTKDTEKILASKIEESNWSFEEANVSLYGSILTLEGEALEYYKKSLELSGIGNEIPIKYVYFVDNGSTQSKDKKYSMFFGIVFVIFSIVTLVLFLRSFLVIIKKN